MNCQGNAYRAQSTSVGYGRKRVSEVRAPNYVVSRAINGQSTLASMGQGPAIRHDDPDSVMIRILAFAERAPLVRC